MAAAWLEAIPGGVRILVLAQPRASRTRIAGEHDGRLKVQLAAAPVEGEANRALIDAIAAWMDAPRSAVTLEAGSTGRRKGIVVRGVTLERAQASLTPER